MTEHTRVGGKAYNLEQLSKHGFNIPKFIVIPCELWEKNHHKKTLPKNVRQHISNAMNTLHGDLFAVRSSASVEDSSRAAFAGQLDTYLNVPRERVIREVRRCWKSLTHERCLAYAQSRGIAMHDARMAVIVQEMVDAHASGVMFTHDPQTFKREIIIVAGLGLGEGIVSDRVQTETYRKVTPAEKSNILTSNQRKTLQKLGRKIEQCFGKPQDIEWSLDKNGQFWILQSRDITNPLHHVNSLYDNSNVIESYPGITLPLTVSHITHAYATTFAQTLRSLGIEEHQLQENHEAFSTLVESVHGRVYYNLTSWYRMFAMIPGCAPYLTAWESMLGIEKSEHHHRSLRERIPPWGSFLKIITHFTIHFATLSRDMRELEQHMASAAIWMKSLQLKNKNPTELIATYDALSERLLPVWHVTLLNDAYAFIGTALCQWLIQHHGLTQAHLSAWLADGKTLASMEPVKALHELVQDYRKSIHHFDASMQRYIEHYGDRCLEELKLETTTWRDDPGALFSLVQSMAGTESTPTHSLHGSASLRTEVMLRMKKSPIAYSALHLCTKMARRSIQWRESSRLDRTRAFGWVREIFLAMGNRLFEEGHIDTQRDVFWLTIEQISTTIMGPRIREDDVFRKSVQKAKEVYASYGDQDLPHRFRIRNGQIIAVDPEKNKTTTFGEILHGTASSSGIVQGEAMVITHPHANLDVRGKILIARSTDPGWVFLMTQAAGLAVERGSILSHSAIVGRELGLPTVVGVQGLLDHITTGSRIELDGNNGTIRILACV